MRRGREGRALQQLRAALVAVALATSSCKACAPSADLELDAAPVVVRPLPPVPAPAGLVAEVVLPAPQAAWSTLQRGIAGPIALMPSTFGGALCAFVGIDLALAGEIDGGQPAYAAWAEGGWAIAAHVGDPRHVRAALDGDAGRYVAREVEETTVFAPRSGGVAIALAPGGFVVVGAREVDLERLGAYVTRTLPARPVPVGSVVVDVPRAALAGAASDAASRAWSALKASGLEKDRAARAAHGGRAPDFADPPAILDALGDDVDAAIAAVRAAESARVTLTADGPRLELDVVARVAPDAGILRAVATGDAAPLAALPGDVGLALLVRDDPRAGAARTFERIAAALGSRLAAADARALRAALEGLARVRGGWTAVGLRAGDAPAIVVRAPFEGSPEEAGSALRAGIGLAKIPAFREPLRALAGVEGITTAAADPSRAGGPADTATFARGPGRPPFVLAWAAVAPARELLLAGAVGPEAVLTLASMRAGSGGTLQGDPGVADALGRLGSGVAGALVARPGLFPWTARAGAAPVAVAWGRDDAALFARARVPAAVVGELLRRYFGF